MSEAPPTAHPEAGGAVAPTRILTSPFVMVTFVTFVFFVYVGVQTPLIPRLVEDGLGGTEFDIGLNLAVFSIAAIAVRPLLGEYGDRHGRRILMIAGAFLAAAASVASVWVDDRWLLLPLRALAGVGEGALFVGAATMASDLAPADRRAEATSYFSVAVFGGLGIGPVVGETLMRNDLYDRGLVIGAVFAVLAGLFALFVPNDKDRAVELSTAVASDEPQHKFHRAAIRPGVVSALGVAGFATFNAFVPAHAKDVGLSGSSLVFALYSAICLVFRIFGARVPDRLGLGRSVSIALANLAIGLIVLAAVPTPVGLYAGTVVIAVGTAFMYPALMAMTVNSVPEHERTRVIATFTMFFEVGVAGGALVFGLVAELTGKRGGFLGGAISALIGIWFLWRVLMPWLRSRPISASEGEVAAAH